MQLRPRLRLDPGLRAALLSLTLFYGVGWMVGRAAGRVEVTRELITQHGSRPRQ